jgi:hypothetical protein
VVLHGIHLITNIYFVVYAPDSAEVRVKGRCEIRESCIASTLLSLFFTDDPMRLVIISAACIGLFPTLSHAAIVTTAENANDDTFFDGSASASDLVNAGQASLASTPTTTRAPNFGFPGLYNGAAGTNTTDSTFYGAAALSSSVTFTLDTTANVNGYDIQSIRSLAGWTNANITQANQKYELLTRQVGSTKYTSHGVFENSPPFTASTNTPSSSRITLTDSTGIIASNVDAVRFNLFYPGFLGNNNNPGTVYRELDVEGIASASPSVTPPGTNLIQNGSFESPVLGSGSQRFTAGSPFDSNWTITGETTLVRQAFGTVASDGAQWLSLESNGGAAFPNNVGTVSQTFNTVAGESYNLSFDYNALGSNNSAVGPWELTYDVGDGPTTLTIENPAQLTIGAWLHEEIEFVATGATTTLSFTGDTQVSGFFGTAIDNVVVTALPAAVPEPGSLLVWSLVGIASIWIYRRRRLS